MFDPRTIADEADVIIDGFAFIKKEEDRITIEYSALSKTTTRKCTENGR